jgi:hypothetical protein
VRIFFDTEFTQFRDGELLSVGLVSDADDELIVEIHDAARLARANDFCRDVVIPQFGSTAAHRVRSDAELGSEAASWLMRLEGPLTLLYDYTLDWRFLEAPLASGALWPELAHQVSVFNVADVASSEACLAAQDAYFASQSWPGRHHALVDAKALRERWRAHLRAAGTRAQ